MLPRHVVVALLSLLDRLGDPKIWAAICFLYENKVLKAIGYSPYRFLAYIDAALVLLSWFNVRRVCALKSARISACKGNDCASSSVSGLR